MRARPSVGTFDRRPRRVTTIHPGPSNAIRLVEEKIALTNIRLGYGRLKAFADSLLTNRPVHMEVCRVIALSDEIEASLLRLEEILEGLGHGRCRLGSALEVKATKLALRWRRRFSDAVREYRPQPIFQAAIRGSRRLG
jgi:hypothetical protein